MFRSARICLFAFTISLLSLALAGCDISNFSASTNDTAVEATPSYERLSPVAPPATKYEIPQQADNPRKEIWRPGYWSYNGGSFDWVSGTLIARPSPTAVWSPDQWLQHDYGWAFVAGYWL